MAKALILAWWFIAGTTSSGHGGSVFATHGPFVDKAQCDQLRLWLEEAHQKYYGRPAFSWCWWDGKP